MQNRHFWRVGDSLLFYYLWKKKAMIWSLSMVLDFHVRTRNKSEESIFIDLAIEYLCLQISKFLYVSMYRRIFLLYSWRILERPWTVNRKTWFRNDFFNIKIVVMIILVTLMQFYFSSNKQHQIQSSKLSKSDKVKCEKNNQSRLKIEFIRKIN